MMIPIHNWVKFHKWSIEDKLLFEISWDHCSQQFKRKLDRGIIMSRYGSGRHETEQVRPTNMSATIG